MCLHYTLRSQKNLIVVVMFNICPLLKLKFYNRYGPLGNDSLSTKVCFALVLSVLSWLHFLSDRKFV